MQRSNSNRDISNSAPAHMSHGGNTNFVYDLLRKIVQPTCQTHPRLCHETLMARSNSPTLGHPKFPQAGPPDYDDSGATAMRAAASLRR